MSEKLPTRKEALGFLKQSGCRENVIKHVEVVSQLAVTIAQAFIRKGYNVNVNLVEIGALLHDIGRAKTHTVNHAIIGAEIARSLDLPESVVSIIKRHVGGGITAEEAKKLGWPDGIYVPQTLEEKIVCYADKLIEGSRPTPIEKTMELLSKELPPLAIKRIRDLHLEMTAVVGDCKCLP